MYKLEHFSSLLYESNNWLSYIYYSDVIINKTHYTKDDFRNEFIKINKITDEEIQNNKLNYKENFKIPINYSGRQYYEKGTNLKYIFERSVRISKIRNLKLFYKYFLELNKDVDIIKENEDYILNENKLVNIPHTYLSETEQLNVQGLKELVRYLTEKHDDIIESVKNRSETNYKEMLEKEIPEWHQLKREFHVDESIDYLNKLYINPGSLYKVKNVIDLTKQRLDMFKELGLKYYYEFKNWFDQELKYTNIQLKYYGFVKERIALDILSGENNSTQVTFYQFIKDMKTLELSLYEYVDKQLDEEIKTQTKLILNKVKEINNNLNKKIKEIIPDEELIKNVELNYSIEEEDKLRILMPDEEWKLYQSDDIYVGLVKLPLGIQEFTTVNVNKNKKTPTAQSKNQYTRLYNNQETQFVIRLIFPNDKIYANDNYDSLEQLLLQLEVNPYVTIYNPHLHKILNGNLTRNKTMSTLVLYSINFESLKETPGLVILNMSFIQTNMGKYFGSPFTNELVYYKTTNKEEYTKYLYLSDIVKSKIDEKVIEKRTSSESYLYTGEDITFSVNIMESLRGIENRFSNILDFVESIKRLYTVNEESFLDFDKAKEEMVEKYRNQLNNIRMLKNELKENGSQLELNISPNFFSLGYNNFINESLKDNINKISQHSYFGRSNKTVNITYTLLDRLELTKIKDFINELNDYTKLLKLYGLQLSIKTHNVLTDLIGNHDYIIDSYQMSNIDQNPELMEIQLNLIESKNDITEDLVVDEYSVLFQELMNKAEKETTDLDYNLNDIFETQMFDKDLPEIILEYDYLHLYAFFKLKDLIKKTNSKNPTEDLVVDVYITQDDQIDDLYNYINFPKKLKINNMFIQSHSFIDLHGERFEKLIDVLFEYKVEHLFLDSTAIKKNPHLLTSDQYLFYPKVILLSPFKSDNIIYSEKTVLTANGFNDEPYSPGDPGFLNEYRNIKEFYYMFMKEDPETYWKELSDEFIKNLNEMENADRNSVLSFYNEIDGSNYGFFDSTKKLINRTIQEMNLLLNKRIKNKDYKNKQSTANRNYHLILSDYNKDYYQNLLFPSLNKNLKSLEKIRKNYENTLSKYVKNDSLKNNLSDLYLNKIILEKIYTNLYYELNKKINYLLDHNYNLKFIYTPTNNLNISKFLIEYIEDDYDGLDGYNQKQFINYLYQIFGDYEYSLYYDYFINLYYLNHIFNTNFNILTEKNVNKLSIILLNHSIKTLLENETNEDKKMRIYSLYLNSLRMLYYKNKELFIEIMKEINPLSYEDMVQIINKNGIYLTVFDNSKINKEQLDVLIKLINQFPNNDFVMTTDKDYNNIKNIFENLNPEQVDNDYAVNFLKELRKNIEYFLQDIDLFQLIKPLIENVNSNNMNIYYTQEAIDFFEEESTLRNLDKFDFKPTDFYPIYNYRIKRLLSFLGLIIEKLKEIEYEDSNPNNYQKFNKILLEINKITKEFLNKNMNFEQDENNLFIEEFEEIDSMLNYTKEQLDYIRMLSMGGLTNINKNGLDSVNVDLIEKQIHNLDTDIFEENNDKDINAIKNDFTETLELLGKYYNLYENLDQQEIISEFLNEIINEIEMLQNLKTDITHMLPRSAVVFLNRKQYENNLINQSFEILQKLYYTGTISFSIHKNQDSPMHSADINISNYSSHILTPEAQLMQQQNRENFNSFENEFIRDIIIQSGSELLIVLGYGNNIFELPIIFQGVLSNVLLNDFVNIRAESYGRDLLIPKTETDYSLKSKLYINPADMVRKLIHDSGSFYFGLINQEKQVLSNRNTTYGDSLFLEDLLKPDEYQNLSSNIYYPNRHYYIEKDGNAVKRFFRLTLYTVGDVVNNPYIPKSGFTPWDIIKDAQYRLQSFIAYPIDYGYGKNRMFYGKRSWNVYNSDLSTQILKSKKKRQYYDNILNLYKSSSLSIDDQKSINDLPVNSISVFSKKYYVHSEINLLMNDLQTNDEETYNSILVIGPKGKINNNGLFGFINGMFDWINDFDDENITTFNDEKLRIITLYYDENIPDHEIKMMQYWDPNGYVDDVKKIILSNKLSENISKYYDGYLTIQGQPELKPYDRIVINDGFRNMHGEVEVREVTHHFSPTRGFETVVKPSMVTETLLPENIHSGKMLLETVVRGAISGLFLAGAFAFSSFTFGALAMGALSYMSKLVYDGTFDDKIYQHSSTKYGQTLLLGKFEIYNSTVLKPISILGKQLKPQFLNYDLTNKIKENDIRKLKQIRNTKFKSLGLNAFYDDLSNNKFLRWVLEGFGLGYETVYNDIVEQNNVERGDY